MKQLYKSGIAAILVAVMSVSLSGCGVFETLGGSNSNKPSSFTDVNELESGIAYVWKDCNGKDINETSDMPQFYKCIVGDINFKGQEMAEVYENPRSIWMDSEHDELIPTVTSKDKLLYVSDTQVPTEIVFERFADYGYTIGISNLVADGGDHYYLVYAEMDDDDYKYYIDMKSDAAEVVQFDTITRLYLDKVGDVKVNKDSISNGGTVTGLKKDETYICEFYTGTYYQDFKLCAGIHSFGTLERFVSYDYEFLHSNCIAISIPDYFKSGYYFVNGVGLFRYVAPADENKYNGKAYDESIDWNDPIIIYDENGLVVYDPSDPYTQEKEKSKEDESKLPEGDNAVLEFEEKQEGSEAK